MFGFMIGLVAVVITLNTLLRKFGSPRKKRVISNGSVSTTDTDQSSRDVVLVIKNTTNNTPDKRIVSSGKNEEKDA